jgi:hypothetical protein
MIPADAALRARYRSLVTRLGPVVKRLKVRGGRAIFMIGLEDNLTKVTADSLAEIIRSVCPDAEIGRNPCAGCYAGNDGDTAAYIPENHRDSPDPLTRESIVTNDGSSDDLTTLVELGKRAYARDAIFIYWSAGAQGYSKNGPQKPPPARNYHVYSPREQDEIVDFLNQVP